MMNKQIKSRIAAYEPPKKPLKWTGRGKPRIHKMDLKLKVGKPRKGSKSARRTYKICTRSDSPRPPCTPEKKRVCVRRNGQFFLVDCGNDLKGRKCDCKNKKQTDQETRISQGNVPSRAGKFTPFR